MTQSWLTTSSDELIVDKDFLITFPAVNEVDTKFAINADFYANKI